MLQTCMNEDSYNTNMVEPNSMLGLFNTSFAVPTTTTNPPTRSQHQAGASLTFPPLVLQQPAQQMQHVFFFPEDGESLFHCFDDTTKFPPLDFDIGQLATMDSATPSEVQHEHGFDDNDCGMEEEGKDNYDGDDDHDTDSDNLLLPSPTLEPETGMRGWSFIPVSTEHAPGPSSSPEPKRDMVGPHQLPNDALDATNSACSASTPKIHFVPKRAVVVLSASASRSSEHIDPQTPAFTTRIAAPTPAPVPSPAPVDRSIDTSTMAVVKSQKATKVLQGITTEMLSALGYFDLKIEEAASKLNVGVTSLKKHCRVHLGIKRWPARERRSMAALQKCSSQYASKGLLGVSETKLAAKLQEYKALLVKSPDAAMPPALRRVRQRVFKLDHNERRRQKGEEGK